MRRTSICFWMPKICQIYVYICLVCCISCNKDIGALQSEASIISLGISSQILTDTRTLVNDDILRTICTPDNNGNHESIGVWGQYTIENLGQQTSFTEFDGEPLDYAIKATDPNPYNNWNYPGEGRVWQYNAQYDFRACFPQALMTNLMTQMDATIIQGGPINTSVLQEDLLVAATRINTTDGAPDGPVNLDMKHIFSALRFKVRTADGYTTPNNESITSCWLQNQGNGADLFATSGYLVHSGNVAPEIKWYTYESSSVPMYMWEHSGVSFTVESLLYASNGNRTGKEYTQNDGWLLVIPQQVKAETLQFCFTMSSTGNTIFRVNIPAITYKPATRYTYVLEISGANVNLDLTIAEWNKIDSTHDIVM